MFTQVVFGRVNIRSPTIPPLAASPYFSMLVQTFEQQHALWVWDESRPYSGEAWLIEISKAPPDQLTGWPAAPPIVGAVRHTAHPSAVIAFALDRQDRQLVFTSSEALPKHELARRLRSVFPTVARRIGGVPEDISLDVDLVCSSNRLREWLETHRDVRETTLWIRRSNPGLDLRREQERIIGIVAERGQLTLTAFPHRPLQLNADIVSEIGAEIEKGDADVLLKVGPPPHTAQFDSRETSDDEPLSHAVSELRDAIVATVNALIRRVRIT